jgi:hypothetical protein
MRRYASNIEIDNEFQKTFQAVTVQKIVKSKKN